MRPGIRPPLESRAAIEGSGLAISRQLDQRDLERASLHKYKSGR